MENKQKNLVNYDITIPEFLKRLQCSEANQNENATLNCVVIGDPIPEITWFKEDGTLISNDDHYEATYDIENGNTQLLIKNAQLSDEQSYKCVATNIYGTAKTIGVLVVKGTFN